MCSLYSINYTPDLPPQKNTQNLILLLVQISGEAWKLQKPHLQFSGPRRGDGVHVCHLYGNVWFGVPDLFHKESVSVWRWI